MQVKVSIIIPVYNSGSFIIDMIDCILKQTYSNWELIIVDDISTDGTYEKVIDHTIKEKSRIKLIKRDSQLKGAQTCRNIGFANSTGEYVVFFDADDLISINCLQQRVHFLDKRLDLDFAVFPAITFLDSKNIFDATNKHPIAKYPKKDDFGALLKAEVPFAVWTNMYRRKSIQNITWDPKIKIFQDFHFNFLSILEELKYEYCSTAKIDYFYRVNDINNGITSSFVNDKKIESTIYLFTIVLNKLERRNDFKLRKKQLFIFCLMFFERIILEGKKDDSKNYILFLDSNYKNNIIKLSFVVRLLLYLKSKKIKKLLFYLLISIFFLSKNHFNVLLSQLKIK